MALNIWVLGHGANTDEGHFDARCRPKVVGVLAETAGHSVASRPVRPQPRVSGLVIKTFRKRIALSQMMKTGEAQC